MAGTGAGPSRRSHTKSRKGCETCKRRHVRCDETFPQCRNCTRYKVNCPYNDVQLPDTNHLMTPDKPDLMWTPQIEAAIREWQTTEVFPFPSLGVHPAPKPHMYSVEDLRLIYHVPSLYHQLVAIDANNGTIWTQYIRTLLSIGATTPYVMHALLALSAVHIAFLTNCPLVGSMAYRHRCVALAGLHEAIGSFCRETSDAILAASLVLCWQATDWSSWTNLMQGTSTVIDAMEAWKHLSQFGDMMAESIAFLDLTVGVMMYGCKSDHFDNFPAHCDDKDCMAAEDEQRQFDAVNELATSSNNFNMPSMKDKFELETISDATKLEDLLPKIIDAEQVDEH